VEDRGLGSCVPYVGLTPQRLLNAILAVLSPSVLVRARQVGGILRRENGVDTAIQFIYRHLPRFLIAPVVAPPGSGKAVDR
jgi:UDP:flavonoid glycosyltransferase YjiC (YdhE family)